MLTISSENILSDKTQTRRRLINTVHLFLSKKQRKKRILNQPCVYSVIVRDARIFNCDIINKPKRHFFGSNDEYVMKRRYKKKYIYYITITFYGPLVRDVKTRRKTNEFFVTITCELFVFDQLTLSQNNDFTLRAGKERLKSNNFSE